jgi:hypothetical protein
LPASGFPRASLAVDPKQVQPISPKGPVLMAENDPYNSVHSTVRPKPVETPEPEKSPPSEQPSKLPDPTKPVMKAEPVESPTEKPVLKAERVEPEETKPVLRAEPVTPVASPKEIRRAEPVHPSDEIPEDSILRATPPPASTPDE